MNENWYLIENIESVDSPALAIYPDRVKENIRIMKSFVTDTSRLRPHVKTNKSAATSKLLLEAGITKFKCATISEAEMLAAENAPDILLAYQPYGPKVMRLVELVEKFPTSKFSCLIDNYESAATLSKAFQEKNKTITVYIDLNVGMNRTGVVPELGLGLYEQCKNLKGINIIGLHPYDGHARESDLNVRKAISDKAYARVKTLQQEIEAKHGKHLVIVAGGTTTFSIHSKRTDVECSPGTLIYWDKGYSDLFQELQFQFAALVITRVISKPTEDTICIDLGHKSIASENPLKDRVYFLNAPDLQPLGHSEEHMILKIGKHDSFEVGDVLYGVPFHICPTVALYEDATIVENRQASGRWVTTSRKRMITV